MALFLLVLSGLGVANFVESTNSQAKTGQQFFGLMYILMAVLLIPTARPRRASSSSDSCTFSWPYC